VLRRQLPRLIRYASVSVVATATSLTVLGLLVGLAGAPAGWSNVAATAAGTVPSFELNRRWVWRKRGRRSLASEVVPFVLLSFAGLVVSTWAAHAAGAWASGRAWPALARTLLVLAANLAAYGSLWVMQFLILDRVLFRPRASQAGTVDGPQVPWVVPQRRSRRPC
jgi:putative flippase GtrA